METAEPVNVPVAVALVGVGGGAALDAAGAGVEAVVLDPVGVFLVVFLGVAFGVAFLVLDFLVDFGVAFVAAEVVAGAAVVALAAGVVAAGVVAAGVARDPPALKEPVEEPRAPPPREVPNCGGVIANTAPRPPIVPVAINSARFISLPLSLLCCYTAWNSNASSWNLFFGIPQSRAACRTASTSGVGPQT